MQKVRVAHVIHNLQRGGAERLTLDICRELNRRANFETLLIVFENKNEYPELSHGVHIIQCRSKVYWKFPWRLISDIEDLNAIISDFKPDVIHSHLFYADQVTRELIKDNIAYFSHIHGITTQYAVTLFRKWFTKRHIIQLLTRNRIVKRYLACHNQFIANSSHTRQYIIDTLKWDKKSIHLLLNSIDLSRFQQVNRRLSLQPIRLVSTGSLIERKNHIFLIPVISKLCEMGFHPILDILGDGPLFNMLKDEIKSKDLTSSIHLRGMVQDVESYLSVAVVYIHAATYEPFGLALVEALATGLPVVCLNAKGNREIIENGRNGFLVEQRDPKLFADKILEIVKDEETYHRFSTHAYESAQQYDVKLYVNKLEKLYTNELSIRRDRISK